MTVSEKPVLGMILKGYPRVSETFISNEILLLEQLGFSIQIFSMRLPRESFCHDSVRRIRARVDYLPDMLLGHLPRLLYPNLLLARKTPAAYGRTLLTACRRIQRSRKPATLKHLLQAGYLVCRLLPGLGVAHLHAHFAHSPTSVALFASQLSGLPFSFTAHAKDIYTSDPRQLREKLERAKFAVTCTEYNRQFLYRIANGVHTPIYRIYHGIEIDLFSQINPKPAPMPPYRILTVARLTRKKGIPTLLRSLRQLCDRGIALRYTLIGDGEERSNILSMIRSLKLEPVVRWLGTRPHETVLEQYRQADVFLLGCEIAANGDRDGIPNVLMESMAMGVPVVATRVSAIAELVDHEKTGLLVPPGQPDKMASAAIRLLTDQGLRKHIIDAARQRVVRDFDNRVLIRSLAELYRRHLGNTYEPLKPEP